jgi:hypothetical protein
MKFTKQLLTIFAFAAALTLPASAAIIADYDFTGGSTASGATASGITASAFNTDAGAGLSGTDVSSGAYVVGGDDTTVNSGGTPEVTPLSTHVTNSITANSYASFSVTVSDAATLDLTSFDYDWSTINTYLHGFALFSDETGFTLASQSYGGSFADSKDELPRNLTNQSIDLSGITALQGLTDTTVEFRLYFFENSGSATRSQTLDNIVLNGDVTLIPEPSSFALMSLAGLLLFTLRRRRHA